MIIANEAYYREQVTESLRTAVSSVHISSDLWFSPNRYSLLDVTAQWVDVNYGLQTALLALPECRHTHGGEHQAELLLQVLEAYGIVSKIGWHTGDNATSNDTTLHHLERLLRAKGILFNAKQRRVRCIAHIINLSLQAFLLASSKEALEAAFAEAAEVEDEGLLDTFSDVLAVEQKREAERSTIEKAQAVQTQSSGVRRSQSGKRRRANTAGSVASHESVADAFVGIENIPALRTLHNLAKLLRSPTIYIDLWRDTVRLQLGIDNRTRWNSWYYFIGRAKRMKPRIVEFMFQHEIALGVDRLTKEDRQILDRAHEFLETFAEATLYGEGNSSTSQFLLAIEILLKKFGDEKKRYSSGPEKDLRMESLASFVTIAAWMEASWSVSPEVDSLTVDSWANAVVCSPTSARLHGAKLAFGFFKMTTVSALASIL